jgi:hypothetical protein
VDCIAQLALSQQRSHSKAFELAHPFSIMHQLFLAFFLFISLHIVSGKYDRTNDLYDFYAGNPQGLPVVAFLEAVFKLPSFPPSLHVIYVGDCADFVAEDAGQILSIGIVSYQCLDSDEDVDTCRYSLQADDRDLDFMRDSSCSNAIVSRSQVVEVLPSSNVPEQSATSILLLPFHCGCNDFLHPSRVTMQLLQDLDRSGVTLSGMVFGFNCKNPDFVSLFSDEIDTQLRIREPFFVDHGAPWTMRIGQCDWTGRDLHSPDSKLPASPRTENCSGKGSPNVLVTVFDIQMLTRLSSCFTSAVSPKVSLHPRNGSAMYCDTPLPFLSSWLHHSKLQPLASSHRFNAGILEFRSPYLTSSPSFLLQFSQESTTVLLKCSDILPSAPLLVHLEASFELFSTIDDLDGGNLTFLYTLATPCAMPHAQIPYHYRTALHDAAIFTWDESNSSIQPPVLRVRVNQSEA